MKGRRLWFVGIGGAGLSGYAQLARAWGAEVGGWDRVQTPYLDALTGMNVEIAPEPVVPGGRSSCASWWRARTRSSSAARTARERQPP